jgi:toxin ParE1/3/4
MPSRELRLALAPRAQADLLEIYFYTIEKWGDDQAAIYKDRIETAINHLLQFPKMGQVSRRAGRGIRSFTVERHTVYYRQVGDMLQVLRIVNFRQEFRSSMLASSEDD